MYGHPLENVVYQTPQRMENGWEIGNAYFQWKKYPIKHTRIAYIGY